MIDPLRVTIYLFFAMLALSLYLCLLGQRRRLPTSTDIKEDRKENLFHLSQSSHRCPASPHPLMSTGSWKLRLPSKQRVDVKGNQSDHRLIDIHKS